MTRIYNDKGAIVPVTVVEAGPCAVTQVKTVDSDGYNAVQLGFGDIKAKFSTFGLIGHAAKAGLGPKKHLREIKLKDATDKKAGDEVKADIFEGVQYVDVIGVSKGKGVRGRHEAAPLRWPARFARHRAQAPLARLDRVARHVAWPVWQAQEGLAHGRSHGVGPGNDAQSPPGQDRRRQQPAAHQRSASGTERIAPFCS
jgi:hypothetical protein